MTREINVYGYDESIRKALACSVEGRVSLIDADPMENIRPALILDWGLFFQFVEAFIAEIERQKHPLKGSSFNEGKIEVLESATKNYLSIIDKLINNYDGI